MRRITVGCRVSTEAWRFDNSKCLRAEDRWSYSKFREEWPNARVYGTVTARSGQKFDVKWDIDGETIPFEIDCLFKESGMYL